MKILKNALILVLIATTVFNGFAQLVESLNAFLMESCRSYENPNPIMIISHRCFGVPAEPWAYIADRYAGIATMIALIIVFVPGLKPMVFPEKRSQ